MPTRTELTPAYVLHGRNYRETSVLLEVLSREYGRVGLVARGARGGRSRLRGVLRPFLPLLVSWSGRGELGTLTGAEADGPVRLPEGAMLAGGFYLNELLIRLLARNDPHPALFDAYDRALVRMSERGTVEPALRVFETRLLSELGYALLLSRESGGEPVRRDRLYRYHLEEGPVAVPRITDGMLGVHGETLLAMAAEDYANERVLAEAKQLNRAALSQYLGGRPLRSRDLVRRRGRDPNATDKDPD